MFLDVLFYAFSTVLIAAASGVVFSRNPVHAVMFLVLTFFNSAVLWLLLEAEFLAIVLVLVYVGAVMVLFLFVVMMLDVNAETLREGFTHYAPIGLLVALVMAIELGQVIWVRSFGIEKMTAAPALPENYSNTKELGAVMYTEYVYAFELASVILLLAIVAAITLTMRKRPGLKVQDIARQVSVRREDRVRLVDVPSEERQ
ncbi:MAG: NADH-quinone oxidoreductase subunit J [Pseudomonadota bacterium]